MRVRLQGESPLRYFDSPPRVSISVGDRTLGEWQPEADFVLEVSAPAALLEASAGRLVLQSDRVYVPAEREGSADRRRLSLRVYRVDVVADP